MPPHSTSPFNYTFSSFTQPQMKKVFKKRQRYSNVSQKINRLRRNISRLRIVDTRACRKHKNSLVRPCDYLSNFIREFDINVYGTFLTE
jgi:hypothetical protein